jgi:hypothetical protein
MNKILFSLLCSLSLPSFGEIPFLLSIDLSGSTIETQNAILLTIPIIESLVVTQGPLILQREPLTSSEPSLTLSPQNNESITLLGMDASLDETLKPLVLDANNRLCYLSLEKKTETKHRENQKKIPHFIVIIDDE